MAQQVKSLSAQEGRLRFRFPVPCKHQTAWQPACNPTGRESEQEIHRTSWLSRLENLCSHERPASIYKVETDQG